MARSEQEIEQKIDKAVRHLDTADSPYVRGVRDALGWVVEEEDLIVGLDDD